ncbi:MAG: hypothetical protein ACJA0P_003790 [Planctomycetota bacterium]|jgi:hypothetical protein
MLRVAGPLLAAHLLLASTSAAQTIDDLRNQIRSELQQDQFAGGLVTLIMLSSEMELSGINLELDDPSETQISALVLPFNYTFHPFESRQTGLYTEGVIGCSVMEQGGPDLFMDGNPALTTSFDTEWTTVGGLVGIGPERHLSEELSVAVIGQVGMSYMENRTTYGGPGAALTSQLLDGLMFNWSAVAATYGLAGRLHWRRELAAGRALEATARYDVRWTDSIETDDVAQEFSTMSVLTTMRMQYSAPTGLSMGDYPLGWRAHTGISRIRSTETADPFGVIEVGGGFDLLTQDDLPLVDGMTIGGSIFLGDGIAGWTVGVGVVF